MRYSRIILECILMGAMSRMMTKDGNFWKPRERSFCGEAEDLLSGGLPRDLPSAVTCSLSCLVPSSRYVMLEEYGIHGGIPDMSFSARVVFCSDGLLVKEWSEIYKIGSTTAS